jgi:hypothetical protein
MADADIIPDSLTIFQATQVDWRITASPCVKRMPIGDNAENNTVRGTFRFDYDGTSMSWFDPDVDMSANNSVSNGTNGTNAGCSELTNFKIVQDDLAFFKGIQDLGECCALCTEFVDPVNAALSCGAYTVNASGCGLKVDSVGVQTDPGSDSGVPMVGSGSKAAAKMAPTKVPARLMRGETAEVIISATPSSYLNKLNKEITKSFRLQWMADIAASGQTEGAFFSSTVENSLRFKVTLQGTNQMLRVLVKNEYTFLDMFSAVGGLAVAVAGAIYTVINTVELAQEYAIETIKAAKEARRLELIAAKKLQQMEKNAAKASKHLGTGIITSVGAMEHQLEHGVGAGVSAATAAANKVQHSNGYGKEPFLRRRENFRSSNNTVELTVMDLDAIPDRDISSDIGLGTFPINWSGVRVDGGSDKQELGARFGAQCEPSSRPPPPPKRAKDQLDEGLGAPPPPPASGPYVRQNQSDGQSFRRYAEIFPQFDNEMAADEEAADADVGAKAVGAKCSSVDGFDYGVGTAGASDGTEGSFDGEDSGYQSPKLQRRSAKAKAKKEKEEVRAQAKKVREETKKLRIHGYTKKGWRASPISSRVHHSPEIAPLSSDEHHVAFESNPVGSDALENRLDSLYPAYSSPLSSPQQHTGAIEVAINDLAGVYDSSNEWHLPEESSPAGPPVDMAGSSGIAIIFSNAAAACEVGSDAREVECFSEV